MIALGLGLGIYYIQPQLSPASTTFVPCCSPGTQSSSISNCGLETGYYTTNANTTYFFQSTFSCSSTTKATGLSTTCVVAVPPPQGVYIRVVNDSGTPVTGLPITIQSTPSAPCNGSPPDLTNSVIETNSSGWILFQGGFFYYSVFNYSGETFNFTLPSDPMAWTIATIRIPSGNLTSQICGLGGANDTTYCQASQTAVVSPESSSTTISNTGCHTMANTSIILCPTTTSIPTSGSSVCSYNYNCSNFTCTYTSANTTTTFTTITESNRTTVETMTVIRSETC
jgi:hypothetical protein